MRSFGLKGGLGPTLAEGWRTLTEWLAPGVAHRLLGPAIAFVAVAVVAAVIGRAFRRERPLLLAAGLVTACYTGIVLFSRLFADEAIPLDDRLLSPIFVFVSLGVAVAAASLWGASRSAMRWPAACALVIWLVASGWRTGAAVADARDSGWGYAGVDWLNSDLVRWLRTEGAGYALFSNNPADVWFATGRRSWNLPETSNPDSVAAFGVVLRQRHGLVIGFEEPLEEMVRPEEISGLLALPIIARLDGAAVWGPKSP